VEPEETQGDDVAVYRPPGRPGVKFFKVQMAADALLREGTRPTVEKIRAMVGGSPNTIIVHLDKWWESLAKRIEIGSEAFERLPRPYAQLAESFFHQSMEEFRKIARDESSSQRDEATAKADETRRRTLLLDEREKELSEAIADRDHRIASLETALAERSGQLLAVEAERGALLRRLGRMTIEIRRTNERLLMSPIPKPQKRVRTPRVKRAEAKLRQVRPTSRSVTPQKRRQRATQLVRRR
jgi:hypothetical protein